MININGYNVYTHEDEVEFSWDHVYVFLKSVNGKTTKSDLHDNFRGIDDRTLHEGIFEYNQMSKGSNGYFEPFTNKEEE